MKFTDGMKLARNIACKEFNYYENDYLPHMSLAYGNYDKSIKLQMAEEIDEIPDGFLADKIFLTYNNEIDLRWEIINCFDSRSLRMAPSTNLQSLLSYAQIIVSKYF